MAGSFTSFSLSCAAEKGERELAAATEKPKFMFAASEFGLETYNA